MTTETNVARLPPPIGSDAEPRWYAFRAAAGREATAEAHLARQGFTTFLPRLAVVRRHARKVEMRKVWLFPRYGFVALDVTRQRWRSVNGTLGVEGLVMGADRPLPVPRGVVEDLRARADGDGVVDFDRGLTPGSPVQLTDGPFAGALATLVRLDDRGRAELLLALMTGAVRVKVDRDRIIAAPPPAKAG